MYYYITLSVCCCTRYYYSTTHILASEKTWGDLLDILRSYIFHSGNSYPKFLTKKFSAALYFSCEKNEDSTSYTRQLHRQVLVCGCHRFYIKMFLSGIGKVLALGNTYGIYVSIRSTYTGNIGLGFKKTIIHLMPILQQRSETFFLSFLHIQCRPATIYKRLSNSGKETSSRAPFQGVPGGHVHPCFSTLPGEFIHKKKFVHAFLFSPKFPASCTPAIQAGWAPLYICLGK